MNVALHLLTGDDWAVYRDARLRALADSPDAFSATIGEAEAIPESVWRERAGGPNPTLVLHDGTRPVAMGGVFVPAGHGHAVVWGMWTAPEARGSGHGRRILRELVAWCGARGLDVLLHVTEGNVGARRLYTTEGFAPTGVWRPLRDGSGLRVEELRLPLASRPVSRRP